jgi:hypothetical protein
VAAEKRDGADGVSLQSFFTTVTRLPRLIVALVLVAASTTVRGDPANDDFEEAVFLYNRNVNLQRVVALLRKAISEKGQESDVLNVPTRQQAVFLSYRPHAYLAAALARLGNCEEARTELNLATPAGERNIDPKVLQVARKTCPPVVEQPKPQPPTVKPPVTGTTAPLLTTSIVDPLDALRNDLKGKLLEAQRVAALAVNAPLTPRTQRAKDTLARAIMAALSTPPQSEPVIRNLTTSLMNATTAYDAAIKNLPPPQLASAIDTYVKGDYDGTLRILGALNARPPYDAQVVLLRAASRFMQAAAAGDKRPELHARNDLLAYKSLPSKSAILDPHLFNPRFRAAVAEFR